MLKDIFYDQFADIEREEWIPTLLMSFYFFLVIASFWVLKPLKRGVIINFFGEDPLALLGMTFGGAEAEQIGKFLNVIAVYFVVIAFTWLARRYARHWLVTIFAGFFSLAFVGYAIALQGEIGQFTVWSFFVFGDMYNTAMVVLFWAFTNDIWTSDQAKRTYGMVGLGGVLGGFVGATVVNASVENVGRGPLLYGLVAPMIAIVAIAFIVHARSDDDDPRKNGPAAPGQKASAMVEGAKVVFQSKYLLAIAGILGAYEIVSNVVDFQLAATVERQITQDLERDAFFGLVGQITGIGSIVVQLFLTSVVMKRFGMRVALAFLPVAILASSVGFFILPTLAFAAAMSASDNALNYSINQSAREALYTPTDPDATYKAKAFIDMFIQRFGKVVSVGLNLVFVAVVSQQVRWLTLFTLAIIAAWFFLIWYVGRRFREMEGSLKVEEAAP